jgi:DNA repair protein RecO (recombination protein O)
VNRSYKVDAIVLARRNIGETDKLLILYTKQYGKKQVIAKGIRKINSRRASHLEVFSEITAILYQNRNIDLVTEVNSIRPLPILQKKLGRIAYAYIAVELVDRLTAENQENYLIFQKLVNFLNFLNNKNTNLQSAKKELYEFKISLLSELGFIEKNIIYQDDELEKILIKILEGEIKSMKLLTKLTKQL